MLELRMNTDLQNATPQEISFNFDELKEELASQLAYYNAMVVTEAGIRDAKADRAKLNKLKAAIDDRRKEVKKDYLKPYNEFEAKIKELTGLIDQPIKAIDVQLDKYEEARKEKKRAEIEDFYNAAVPKSIEAVIPLERIFDKKWLNVGTTMKSIEDEIGNLVKKTESDLQALDSIEMKYRIACREKYLATLDISAAIAHQEAIKASEEALKAREAERIAREEKKAQEAKMEPQEAPAPQKEPQQQEKRYALRLEFHVTKEQAIALRNFIDQNQMEYIKL